MNLITTTATGVKYNRCAIFAAAWKLVKRGACSIGTALRRIWANAVNALANAVKGIVITEESIIEHTVAICNTLFTANAFIKPSIKRIYINNPTQSAADKGLFAYVDLGFIPSAKTFTNTLAGISHTVVVCFKDYTTNDITEAIQAKLQAQLLGKY